MWNKLKLNAPWSVGYVSSLIEIQNFENKEAWENFYFETGKNRKIALAQLPQNIQQQLNDINLNQQAKQQLSWEAKNLNFNFGRTKEELTEKGSLLFKALNNQKVSLEHCIEAVRFRVICETWNGIIVREHNVIAYLQKQFPKIQLLKTQGSFDHKYAVDYQLHFNEKLICGLQIKPSSYAKNTNYLQKAKQANAQKNKQYRQQFGVEVINILANLNGIPSNQNSIKQIAQLLQ